MSIFYINGDFVPDDEARIPARDLSVLRGYGAFDFLRTYNGDPFRLPRNIQRLRNSCDLIQLRFPWDDDEVHGIVMETLERNREFSDEFSIRLVVTGGTSPDNITPQGNPSLMVLLQPLTPLPDSWYNDGVKVATFNMQRLIPGAKSINYLPAILARKHAAEVGAVEALYVHEGYVTEGTTTNIFAFIDGTLITPQDDILPGLTRRTILELADGNYPVEQRALSLQELISADEAFITAANKRVVPVVRVNGATIANGMPGRRTRHLMQLFDDLTWHCERTPS
jgi:branched-chain amino acid aminotransferase